MVAYLRLPTLLGAQQPLSDEHDGLLFIVVHQATELWLKLCIHELKSAIGRIGEDNLEPAFKMLTRIARIQAHMIQAWEILATMTPFDYAQFRGSLGASSGFQSMQYRQFEFLMGAKNGRMLQVHRADDVALTALEAALNAPSLYDETLRLLAGAASPSRPTTWNAIGLSPTAPIPRSGGLDHHLSRRRSGGTCTSWAKSWWTWNTGCSNGDSRT